MAEYRLTPKAFKDLGEIWHFTVDNWSEEQADKYYRMLLGLCQEIAEDPEVGKRYEEIIPGLLGMKAGRHVIFYRRSSTDQVLIIRILHEQMDLRTRLY